MILFTTTKDAHIILDHFGRTKNKFIEFLMLNEATMRDSARVHEKGLSRVDVCLIAAKRIKINKREEKKIRNSLIKPILLGNTFMCLCLHRFVHNSSRTNYMDLSR